MVSPRKRTSQHSKIPPSEALTRAADILATLEAETNQWAKDGGFEFDDGHPTEKRQPRSSDRPLSVWARNDVAPFLDELLRLEGLPLHDLCHQCGASPGTLRCRHCFMSVDSTFCDACILRQHEELPFHRIDRWTGSFFQPTTLKALGQRVQLGHPIGTKCPATLARLATLGPTQSHDDEFCVVDCNGVHDISIDFCGCPSAGERTTQLLRARLFPATTTRPQTAVRGTPDAVT
ncbi:CxC2 domain-containing protein [Mycena indigotica]|uniref:CxC2 domain-containing protein n=1 Tax=Mycena indigotica TaxID=2126181 RepID=A0A8H6SPD0_9AGAR|nr:CxC2 domain-containing protein [Mycena indigotica]KAF7303545.1 CxC2 domain-containing protein [Mycena indigotica]